MVVRATLATLAVLGACCVAPLPLEGALGQRAYHQWGPGVSAAPVPAGWHHVEGLEVVLTSHGVPVVYRDNCPDGLEGLYDPRGNQVLMCRNTMPNTPENYWNTLAHESVHVMQVCRDASPLSVGLERVQAKMLEGTPEREKLYIISAYPPEQRLYELEARWVANTFDPDAVIRLLDDSCTASASRPTTQALLSTLLASAGA